MKQRQQELPTDEEKPKTGVEDKVEAPKKGDLNGKY